MTNKIHKDFFQHTDENMKILKKQISKLQKIRDNKLIDHDIKSVTNLALTIAEKQKDIIKELEEMVDFYSKLAEKYWIELETNKLN
jgi:hypothetical protein